MRTVVNFAKGTNNSWFRTGSVIVACLVLLTFPSCQDYEVSLPAEESSEAANLKSTSDLTVNTLSEQITAVYYGHKVFKRSTGAPVVETEVIKNPDYNCFDSTFVLKIQNGDEKMKRVASAEIRIDGIMIAGPADFSKNVTSITKPIKGLKPESKLEVKLNSTPGSFIDIWIEGTKNIFTPVFKPIGPLCQNSTPPALPSGSSDTPAITGTWQPASINTSAPGKAAYTFTPAEGQCAVPVTLEIEVIALVTPVFTQIGPLTQGSVPPALPLTSNNGITGNWNPEVISTSSSGTIKYTFSPTAGQCAISATMDIVIISNTGTVTDIDGNTYKPIKIGDQWWIAENLKVTKYRNGDLIGTTTPSTKDIWAESAPKYQWAYEGNESNVAVYGRLYTWYTITDSRGVCPTGWHIPTDAEWTVLADYLTNNGYGYGGSGPDIAKSLAAKSGWAIDATPGNTGNDQASNNSSGFNVLPGGDRKPDGTFEVYIMHAGLWSVSESSTINAWYRGIDSNQNYLVRGNCDKKYGGSIRCIKD